MASFVFYAPIPPKEIRATIKPTINDIRKWFKKNPKREDCRAQLWYGKTVSVTREDVEKVIKKEAELACKEYSAKRKSEEKKPKKKYKKPREMSLEEIREEIGMNDPEYNKELNKKPRGK